MVCFAAEDQHIVKGCRGQCEMTSQIWSQECEGACAGAHADPRSGISLQAFHSEHLTKRRVECWKFTILSLAQIIHTIHHSYHVPSPPQYVHVDVPGPTVTKQAWWPRPTPTLQSVSTPGSRSRFGQMAPRWSSTTRCLTQCRSLHRPRVTWSIALLHNCISLGPGRW